jgi:hypothetical protein
MSMHVIVRASAAMQRSTRGLAILVRRTLLTTTQLPNLFLRLRQQPNIFLKKRFH